MNNLRLTILLLAACLSVAASQIPKDFDPLLGPGDQKATQEWAWSESGFVVRLTFHVIQSGPKGEKKAEEKLQAEWKQKIETLVNGQKAGQKKGENALVKGLDKGRAGILPSLNDYFYGSGVSFIIAEVRFIQASPAMLREGSSWEYLKIANRHKREDSLNVYITPTQIKDLLFSVLYSFQFCFLLFRIFRLVLWIIPHVQNP